MLSFSLLGGAPSEDLVIASIHSPKQGSLLVKISQSFGMVFGQLQLPCSLKVWGSGFRRKVLKPNPNLESLERVSRYLEVPGEDLAPEAKFEPRPNISTSDFCFQDLVCRAGRGLKGSL